MTERLYYMPNLCNRCNKLNPENILVVDGTYRASYSDYVSLNEKLPKIKIESGGTSTPLKKLFIRNGHYK
ncbi:putative thioredoxin [Adoxophyes honmai entomopoxvirus 'L']|uniref:Thioredoxin n=1 Tax=Adoxophyes honmai entomopoxvirus 'L' TaxID=1293540 RepID=A0A916P0T3_9POXV|nr:putative thioredoxin [Adoxophyes honmai entomopoxvirus 'L']CCU55394.1 putative thioredoxin [Adoxophyes honmai entomopoxvirus 'L']